MVISRKQKTVTSCTSKEGRSKPADLDRPSPWGHAFFLSPHLYTIPPPGPLLAEVLCVMPAGEAWGCGPAISPGLAAIGMVTSLDMARIDRAVTRKESANWSALTLMPNRPHMAPRAGGPRSPRRGPPSEDRPSSRLPLQRIKPPVTRGSSDPITSNGFEPRSGANAPRV